jgi:hypothetical protein
LGFRIKPYPFSLKLTLSYSLFLQKQKNRKNTARALCVAPPIGLEPMTDWLTASRSTWLSYGGTIQTYSFEFCCVFKSAHRLIHEECYVFQETIRTIWVSSSLGSRFFYFQLIKRLLFSKNLKESLARGFRRGASSFLFHQEHGAVCVVNDVVAYAS